MTSGVWLPPGTTMPLSPVTILRSDPKTMSDTRQQAVRARQAFLKLSGSVSGAERTEILRELATGMRTEAASVFAANEKDLGIAKGTIAQPLYKRLILNEAKFLDVVKGIEEIAAMDDPVAGGMGKRNLKKDLA